MLTACHAAVEHAVATQEQAINSASGSISLQAFQELLTQFQQLLACVDPTSQLHYLDEQPEAHDGAPIAAEHNQPASSTQQGVVQPAPVPMQGATAQLPAPINSSSSNAAGDMLQQAAASPDGALRATNVIEGLFAGEGLIR
jgi:hypothetical protein